MLALLRITAVIVQTGYYTRLHWQKVDNGQRGIKFDDLINKIKSLKPGSKLRLNMWLGIT